MSSKDKEVKSDRHSRTGVDGKAKKGGAGGKGVWGKPGMDDLGETKIDAHDPNYDSEESEVPKEVIKPRVSARDYEEIIAEFFASGEIEEAAKEIKELKFGDNEKAEFVKKLLTRALEKHAFERELTSQLLSQLYGGVLPSQDIQDGFSLALGRLEDSVLDNPDAVDVMSKFMARAVVDDLLPPAFVKDSNGENALAKEALALAHGMMTEKHRSERLIHIWGPGDLSSVKRLKEEAALLVDEYFTNEDIKEAENSIRKLNAPSFHFQIVKIAIRKAIQKSSTEREKFHVLLSQLAKIGVLSPHAITKGFQLSYQALPDLKLDVPSAQSLLDEFADRAKTLGYLEK